MKTLLKLLPLFFIALTLNFFVTSVASADYTITTGSLAGIDNWGDFGLNSADEFVAQQITTVGAGTISSLKVAARRSGTPVDHFVADIYADTANEPSGASLGTSNAADPAAATCGTEVTVTFASPVGLSPATKYWIRYSRTGALDASNFYYLCGNAGATGDLLKTWNGATWAAQAAVSYGVETIISLVSLAGGQDMIVFE